MAVPLLEVRHLIKRFGGLTAVDDVDLQVFPGEVVGLLGDNGAGKSTLIKMVSGVYQPDGGQILFEGKEVRLASPASALELGIETLYQDLALAENLDVFSNIFMGREKTRPFLGLIPVLDHQTMHDESKKVLDRLDIQIPSLRKLIKTLSGGQRQAVAIGRSIYWNAKLLIMDEPTAALGVQEQKKVLDLVRMLRSQGIPVIIISHQMYDVFAVTDRLVVMRRGKKVAERITKQTDTDEVVGLITGAEEVTKTVES
ncbi:MAG TPA: ATP-binding cassette domain-containing protein [Anaeromyxobacter sp.]|nr:ATP-binding cassette domain-containing protein [Anaeromyxobacter sp.]